MVNEPAKFTRHRRFCFPMIWNRRTERDREERLLPRDQQTKSEKNESKGGARVEKKQDTPEQRRKSRWSHASAAAGASRLRASAAILSPRMGRERRRPGRRRLIGERRGGRDWAGGEGVDWGVAHLGFHPPQANVTANERALLPLPAGPLTFPTPHVIDSLES